MTLHCMSGPRRERSRAKYAIGNSHVLVARVFPLGEDLTVDESFENSGSWKGSLTMAAHTLGYPVAVNFLV